MSFGQGGSQWGPGGSRPPWGSQTPDWAALADAAESRQRRRRWLLIGGGALATVAIGTAVAVAVVSANSGSDTAGNQPTSQLPTNAALPSETIEPVPSFAPTSVAPPLDPKDFISSAKKDTAPLTPGSLFPGSQLTVGETVYQKGDMTSTGNCASAVQGATLGKVLTQNGCQQLIRASYMKDKIAVTVGVAVFETEAQATKAKQQADSKDNVTSLSGGGVGTFCRSEICRKTTNSYGRYLYLTIAGFINDKDVAQKDSAVFKIGDDLQVFTVRQIHRRGEAQASAAANQ
ncbi:hypothetical protein [Streptomyces cavernae]|uniref:hypothetical protein n=1 Tax=Streptomyces cavernae TaxID=2259034 RepID=UPI000FEC15C8|nr:hypothetical protein [Streptomyces cavernae]